MCTLTREIPAQLHTGSVQAMAGYIDGWPERRCTFTKATTKYSIQGRTVVTIEN